MTEHISLTKEDRTELIRLVESGDQPKRVSRRAKILLLLDRSQGKERTFKSVADMTTTTTVTVNNIKRRYLKGGFKRALFDRHRSGSYRKIDDSVKDHLVEIVHSLPPEGHRRWTLHMLADKLVELGLVESISHVAVRDALRKMKVNITR